MRTRSWSGKRQIPGRQNGGHTGLEAGKTMRTNAGRRSRKGKLELVD